jgi:putative salt-induced outer membrane protein YdiY
VVSIFCFCGVASNDRQRGRLVSLASDRYIPELFFTDSPTCKPSHASQPPASLESFMKPTRLIALMAGWLAAVGAADAQELAGPAVLPPPNWEQAEPLPTIAANGPPGAFESLPPPLIDPVERQSLEDEFLAAGSEAFVGGPLWYEPAFWLGQPPWDMGIELGVNGSEGNNNVFSMRAGGHAKRATQRWKYDSSLIYNKNLANSIETQNNAKLDVRLDRILADSPWTLFFLDNLIYDEFQAWNVQLSLNAGVGYQVLKSTTVDLLSRFGAGGTREFGGVEDDWQPQALFGVDYNHQLTPMQKLTAKVDYYPEWEDFRQYRVVSDLGWQVDLDRPKNVSLKFSVIDRYDSTPDGAVPNNLDYSMLMIWKL